MTTPSLDYLSGVIDARGWFTCRSTSRRSINPNGCGFIWQNYFVLESTDKKLCKTMLDYFKVGKVKEVKSYKEQLNKYYWRIMGDDLYSFIDQVYEKCPYQQKMMDIVILLRNTYKNLKKGVPLPDDVAIERNELVVRFKEAQSKTPWTSKRV